MDTIGPFDYLKSPELAGFSDDELTNSEENFDNRYRQVMALLDPELKLVILDKAKKNWKDLHSRFLHLSEKKESIKREGKLDDKLFLSQEDLLDLEEDWKDCRAKLVQAHRAYLDALLFHLNKFGAFKQ